jgi:hypothetical protein
VFHITLDVNCRRLRAWEKANVKGALATCTRSYHMRRVTNHDRTASLLTLAVLLAGATAASGQEPSPRASTGATAPPAAQPAADPKASFEIYGFAMMDIGHDFKQIDPDWFDTMRVTRLPSSPDEFGRDHNTFVSVRQTRFGVRSSVPTELGELKTLFEFNLFGTGPDVGQTTFRLRHAWGELGALGAGQTWSVFTDPDTFPKTLEFFGPTGLAWFRNVQLRWTPMVGTHTVQLALERPGASGDEGIYADRIELDNIRPRFPVPDFTAAYKYTHSWGYVRAAGLFRRIYWDDVLDDPLELSGDATGWGFNLSSNIKATPNDLIRVAFVFGEAIQNYMNDSPIDIGIVNNFSNPITPILGKPLPIVGLSAFVDHTWNEHFISTLGYSRQDNDNPEGQRPSAFRDGQYALGNVQYLPVPNVMMGGELQWGRRQNFSDGFESDGFKIQFSFKYNFSWKLGG